MKQRTYEPNFVEILTETIADLRSGDRIQTTGQLRMTSYDNFVHDEYSAEVRSYCCLGVVCDHVPGGAWNGDEFAAPTEGQIGTSTDESSIPTALTREWNVMPELNVKAFTEEGIDFICHVMRPHRPSTTGEEAVSMARMNDAGVEFEVIADVMERAITCNGIVFVNRAYQARILQS